jgi:IS5 family transposase
MADRVRPSCAEGHLGRCYLKGRDGDAANAIPSAVGHNLRLVRPWWRMIFSFIVIALFRAFAIQPAVKSVF